MGTRLTGTVLVSPSLSLPLSVCPPPHSLCVYLSVSPSLCVSVSFPLSLCLSVFLYLPLCVYIWVHICDLSVLTCTEVLMPMCAGSEARLTLEYLSLLPFNLIFWDRVSYCTWSLPVSRLASPWDPPVFASQCWSYIRGHHDGFLCGCWGSESKSSCLNCKHLSCWAMSLISNCFCIVFYEILRSD